ncbi:proline iminopeptidase-family hydrolase [Falsibacillus albus]|uniref:Proline iminopeptidase n=1 Tax=Falsibacillus albus TaxID=2478915 RepID=A0A3L7K2C7_9BACI|nr:proline iminopeptidase-family hydrolase [Falsibacillus albus]RLQ96131.1 alpha/beta fold hydrolase [Falsibacillus albus]
MPVKEGFIEVTGGRVWYQSYDGPINQTPVIILHGGPGSSCYTLQVLKVLAKDRPVILYDQLGCGRSDRPKDESLWNIDRFVIELRQIISALSLDEVYILGHSWGTTLAAAYLLSHPKGVKSVIFSSPCLSAPLWAEDQEQNRAQLPDEIQRVLADCERNGTTDSTEYKNATAEFNKRFVCRLDPWPELLKEASSYKNPEVYNLMWGPSEFHVTGNLRDFDYTGELKDIKIPALFTCGRFDEATPKSTEYFSKLTPNGKFHVFEKSAHMPYLEEPEAYAKVIGEFLAHVDTDGND